MISSLLISTALASISLSLHAHAASSPRVLALPVHSTRNSGHRSALLSSRQTASLTLTNEEVLYFANITVGTPGQPLSLQIDTGSTDIFFFGPAACASAQCTGGSYNSADSSTFRRIDTGGFTIQYQTPGSKVVGDDLTDTLTFGSASVRNQQMAVATSATQVPAGVMGIGFTANEAQAVRNGATYPSLLDNLVSQGVVSSRSYALHLGTLTAPTGSLLFGGYDRSLISGALTTVPILPSTASGLVLSFTVSLTDLTLTDTAGTHATTSGPFSTLPVILDSGTSLTVLPVQIYETLANYFGAQYDSQEGVTLVDCSIANQQGTLNFQFGAATIKVPFGNLALPTETASGAASDICIFGITAPVAAGQSLLLGDTFLRSAYVVYNLDAKTIGLGQINLNPGASDIVEIGGSSSTTPSSSSSIITTPSTSIAPVASASGPVGPVIPSSVISVGGSGASSAASPTSIAIIPTSAAPSVSSIMQTTVIIASSFVTPSPSSVIVTQTMATTVPAVVGASQTSSMTTLPAMTSYTASPSTQSGAARMRVGGAGILVGLLAAAVAGLVFV